MSEQKLDGAPIGPGFEQMGGDAVAQGGDRNALDQAGGLAGV